MTTLGRELQRRGHRVTVIARLDAGRKAEAAGLGFAGIGEREFPLGAMNAASAELGRLSGLRAIRFTVELLRRSATAILRDAREIVRRGKMDALVGWQRSTSSVSIARRLR